MLGKKIGLVPTMGFLHDGHLSLIKKSKKLSDITVVSVFVNPTQFGPKEDFNRYPRDINKDKKLLKEYGVDYLFIPDSNEIYPGDFQTYVDVSGITKILEGEIRPGHFKGVTTIVSILFNCVKPHYAFFGQKDAQQVAVIKQMIRDLKYDIKLVLCPIVREADGLAMSSRNVYLSPEERSSALILNKSLRHAAKLIKENERNSRNIIENMKNILAEEGSVKVDYIEIVNACGFKAADYLENRNEYYVLIAARVGNVRLIDNLFIKN